MSQPVKRCVIKKRVKQQENEAVDTQVVQDGVVAVEQPAPLTSADFPKVIVPSSRVHTYVSGFRLNKEVDEKVKAVKECSDVFSLLSAEEADLVRAKVDGAVAENEKVNKLLADIAGGAELTAVLDEDQQRKIGDIIKKREERNAKLPEEERAPINIKDVATDVVSKALVTPLSASVDVLSKHRAKFSKSSFDVLSAFSDVMIEEITEVAMTNLLSKKKNTITPAFVFCDEIKNCKLYNFFSKLPSFVSAQEDFNKPKPKGKKRKAGAQDVEQVDTPPAEVVPVEQVVDVPPVDEVPVDVPCKVNFDFYIKAICNKLKATNTTFADVKISEKYQKFCSSLILDVLDVVSTVSLIVLKVMDTKTITGKLFKTCLHLQTFQCPEVEDVLAQVDERLA